MRAWIAQRLTMGSAGYGSHLTNGHRRDEHPWNRRVATEATTANSCHQAIHLAG
jgi:hypothetical protein